MDYLRKIKESFGTNEFRASQFADEIGVSLAYAKKILEELRETGALMGEEKMIGTYIRLYHARS